MAFQYDFDTGEKFEVKEADPYAPTAAYNFDTGVKTVTPGRPDDRGIIERGTDFYRGVQNAAVGLVKSGVDLIDPDSGASKTLGDFIKESDENASPYVKSLKSQYQTAMTEAKARGDWGVVETLSHYLSNPVTILLPEAIGNYGPLGAVGKVAKVAGAARAAAGGADAAGVAAAGTKAALGATSTAGGVAGAGGVRGGYYEKIMGLSDEQLLESPQFNDLVAGGLEPAEAKRTLATQVDSKLATGIAAGGLIGAASARLGWEEAVFGKQPSSFWKSVGKEIVPEALEGGVQQMGTNLGVQSKIPSQSLWEDVASSATAEAVVSGPGAAMGGAVAASRKRDPVAAVEPILTAKTQEEATAAAQEALKQTLAQTEDVDLPTEMLQKVRANAEEGSAGALEKIIQQNKEMISTMTAARDELVSQEAAAAPAVAAAVDPGATASVDPSAMQATESANVAERPVDAGADVGQALPPDVPQSALGVPDPSVGVQGGAAPVDAQSVGLPDSGGGVANGGTAPADVAAGVRPYSEPDAVKIKLLENRLATIDAQLAKVPEGSKFHASGLKMREQVVAKLDEAVAEAESKRLPSRHLNRTVESALAQEQVEAVEELSKKPKSPGPPTILDTIAAQGGMSIKDAREHFPGITEEDLNREINGQRIFRQNGSGIEQMRSTLQAEGFLNQDHPTDLEEKVGLSLSGTPQYTPTDAEIAGQLAAAADPEDALWTEEAETALSALDDADIEQLQKDSWDDGITDEELDRVESQRAPPVRDEDVAEAKSQEASGTGEDGSPEAGPEQGNEKRRTSGAVVLPATTETETVKLGAMPDKRTKNDDGSTTLSKREAVMVQKLAGIFGKKVVFYQGNVDHDGYVKAGDDSTIYINVNGSSAHHMVVVGHELTHLMKRDQPALYEALKNKLVEGITQQQLEKFSQHYNSGETAAQAKARLEDAGQLDSIVEEFISDLVGNRAGELKTFTDLFAADADPSLIYKLGQFIIDFVDNLLAKVRVQKFAEAEGMVKDLEQAKKDIRETLLAYAKAQNQNGRLEMLKAQRDNIIAARRTGSAVADNTGASPTTEVVENGKATRARPEEPEERAGEGRSTKAARGEGVLPVDGRDAGTDGPRPGGRQAERPDEAVTKSTKRGVTDSPAFKKWFGESKVVNEDGSPKVVYHGTTRDFSKFNPKAKQVSGDVGYLGSFFTESTKLASAYAEDMRGNAKEGGQVMPVYLSLQNPKIESIEKMEDIEMSWDKKQVAAYKGRLLAAGHDGIVFQSDGASEFVAFRPEQIKSATGNQTFDPADANITKSTKREPTVEANIARGQKAMERALTEKVDVNRAMFRPGMGWVDFRWGDAKHGVEHILARRQQADGMTQAEAEEFLRVGLVETVALGDLTRSLDVGSGSVKSTIDYEGKRVILVKNPGSNAWLLTGFELKPGGQGAVSDASLPTQLAPTPSRRESGAGTNTVQPDAEDGKKDPESKKGYASDATAAFREEIQQKYPGVDLDLYGKDTLNLSMIRIPKGQRRAGLGTKIMNEVIAHADAQGKRITLSPTGEFGMGRARLTAFYKRFGFVENKGRNKDFSISESMYREPIAVDPDITKSTKRPPNTPQTETPAFKNWFRQSKVVDAEGKPKRVFHGTARPDRIGSVFQAKRATSGPMAYFTDDPGMASNYAAGKQDTSLGNEDHPYSSWYKLKVEGQRKPVDIDRAWYFLPSEKRAEIAALAPRVATNDDGDIILEPDGYTGGIGGYDQHLKEARGNHLAALVDGWLNGGTLFGQEEEFAKVLKLVGLTGAEFDSPQATYSAVMPVYLSIQNPLVTAEIPDSLVQALEQKSKRTRKKVSQYGADAWDKNSQPPQVWMAQLKTDLADQKNTHAWSSIPDWVTDVLKDFGYDGIHDTGGKNGGAAHSVWIPFTETQVKSATGNKGTFDPSKKDITKSTKRTKQPSVTEMQAEVDALGKQVRDRGRQFRKENPDAEQISDELSKLQRADGDRIFELSKQIQEATRPVERTEDDIRKTFQRSAPYVNASPAQQKTLDTMTRSSGGFEDLEFHVAADDAHDDVYNSADSNFEQSVVVPDVFEVPMESLGTLPGYNDAKTSKRIAALAARIKEDGITPVFVGIDPTGEAFVMEGQHRVRALASMGYQSVPARVVIDMDPITKSTKRTPYLGDVTPAQQAARTAVGFQTTPKTWKEQTRKFTANWQIRLKQGITDKFAAIKELNANAYMLARMSAAEGSGALEAMLMYGKVFIKDGVYDVKVSPEGGFAKVLADLGGEHNRFLEWVAAKRAEQLKKEGRENLFTDQDISALLTLNVGREAKFDKALLQLNEYNEAVLRMALESGLLDQEAFDLMKSQPYVPFYRVMQDDSGPNYPTMSGGLTNKRAVEKLRGGKEKLREDLLASMMQNWSHLFAASAKNRAAVATIDASVDMMGAYKVPVGSKGSVKIMRDGFTEAYMVEDPHLFEAISAVENTIPNWQKPFGAFKRALTFGVTVSPTFKIRNLIRDSLSAIAQSDLSYNPLGNVGKGMASTNPKSQTYASMLAGGGLMRFGTQENSDQTHRVIREAMAAGTILDEKGAAKLWGQIKTLGRAYQDVGDRLENVNRAALYDQLIANGSTHAEAAFASRDLMDFSMGGSHPLVRFLTTSVPFLNARIQGLYKLGRAGYENPKRLGYMVAAVSMASMALAMAYADDEDWKKREDWDRDGYWWFKIGSVAYRIPKPFELGSMGTIAERTLELFTSKEMTAGRYGERIAHMLTQTFSFSAVPQAFKPLLDLYANKDAFTGRGIESMGMERLQKEDRYTERTSQVARILGGKLNPVYSPVQMDHLIRAYTGWLGTTIVAGMDYGLRPMMGRGEKPAMQLRDVFVAGNFMESLPTGSSRYVTEMYKSAQKVEQAYASYRDAVKRGDTEEAAERMAEDKKLIDLNPMVVKEKKRLSDIGSEMKQIESSRSLSAEAKRVQLDLKIKQRNEIAKQLAIRLSN